MQLRQALLTVNGQTRTLTPNRSNSWEEIFAEVSAEPLALPFPEHAHATITQARPVEGMAYSVFLHPKQDVSLQRLEMQFDLPLPAEARMLANGYQSWSETRKLRVSDGIPRLFRLAGAHMGLYGDEHIPGIPRGKGRLHSWTYTLIEPDPAPRSAFPPVWLVGSRNERTGFTLMLYDWKQGILTVRKDLEGLELSHSFPALDFVALHGAEALLYQAYFQQLGIEPPAAPPAIGWTSWYRHFTRISEETALHNLAAFAACRQELRQTPLAAATEAAYFQIDDGWQTQVGDWLSAKPDFPKGMAALAAGIRREGLWPGLWLAPFVASRHSDLARRHPDWLLKDAQGRPLRAGWNPLWGGWYYALDFYCPAVQEYLAGVFHVVCEKWGYELLKLDFLFAAALRPPKGKTRGQVMAEVMEFLRRQVGQRRILACGVPLGCCFGTVEYCRIGGDVHMAWSHPLLRLLRHRERVDTWSSLRSTLSRWPLGGRAFHNDPDVFMLRADHQRLSPTQQYTLLTINALLGGLLFTSDDVGAYSPEQMSEWHGALAWTDSRVGSVREVADDLYCIEFVQDGQGYTAWCNLSPRPRAAAEGQPDLAPFETWVASRPTPEDRGGRQRKRAA